MTEDLGGNRYVVSVTTESTSPVTIRYQAEFLYGPPGVLFDIEPQTLVRHSPQAGRE